MIWVKSKALDQEIAIEREIGHFGNSKTGPTIVVFAGIHGNEPSGVFALKSIFSTLENIKPEFKGHFIALAGNTPALERGKRYIKQDLNRVWHSDIIHKIKNNGLDDDAIMPELEQQIKIYKYIDTIFKKYNSPYYFIDLHTTSSDSVPFITINDTIRNRNFALEFPLPVILGIEEFLSGTVLSYVNELGPIALGFEAGNHDVLSSIDNHISCLWLTLVAAGCLQKEDVPNYAKHYEQLKNQSPDSNKVFEIRFRHQRTEVENFIMDPGYENFHSVKKNQHLAKNINGDLSAPESGRIFLPLYQEMGDDGYFIIREIKLFWLKVSAKLRTYKAECFIKYFPGIHMDKKDCHTFKVNAKIGRWFIKDLFHLLGFRRSSVMDRYVYFTRRKFDVAEPGSYNDKYIDKNL